MRNLILIFLMSIFLVSCMQNEFQDILFRTADDPKDCYLSVDSLTSEDFIDISWEKDYGADTYILMRSNDGEHLDFTSIYEGTENNFLDTDIEDCTKYIYRLDKRRGKRLFYGSHYGYGFSVPIRNDQFEPNDCEKNAVILESDKICNLPCAVFITDRKMYVDEDWFNVKIPPRRKAEVVVTQSNLQQGNSATDIYVLIPGESPKGVFQGIAFQLNNPSDIPIVASFKLYPDMDKKIDKENCVSAIEYVVQLSQIIKY